MVGKISNEDSLGVIVLTGASTFGLVKIDTQSELNRQGIESMIQIYGKIQIDGEYSVNQPISAISCAGYQFTTADVKNPNSFDFYTNCGFVEGQARIITDYGNIACIVKNGTLYPIISEYDQQVEDNKCLTTIYLNGDNEVSGLQDMVDHPGRYLPYDNTTIGEPWSPVENYLHQNVNMPIVPKIGFEPLDEVGIGNVLPGLNYEVTL